MGGFAVRGQDPVLRVSESGDKSWGFTQVGSFLEQKNAGDNLSNEDSVLCNLFVWQSFVVCGAAAQRGLWPLHSWGFLTTHDLPQSLGLLWTSDQLDAETSTWRNTTL